jgi:hypothetical protein
MTITLADTGTTLALHDDLRWLDEAAWSRVQQGVERSITGALLVQIAERINDTGRPITLGPPDPEAAWMSRATLDQLLAWSNIPAKQLTLSLRGTTHQVLFRHQDEPVIEAEPVKFVSDEDGTDLYLVTIRLMKI